MNPTPPDSESVSTGRLTGVTFVAAYVDDFERAFAFYSGLLGLTKEIDMGDAACYFSIDGNVGLYLEGGHSFAAAEVKASRASFGLTSDSVVATYNKLREAGVRFVHEDGPVDMGDGQAWFQCYDTAGNIIEIVGRRQ